MSSLQLTVLVPGMLVAAGFDVRERRIPNALVLLIALGGLSAAWMDGGAVRASEGGVSAAIALASCLPLYVLRGLAAGDVKLIAAGGLWWTISELVVVLAAIAICGALLATGWLVISRGATHVPYAVAVAMGTCGAAVYL